MAKKRRPEETEQVGQEAVTPEPEAAMPEETEQVPLYGEVFRYDTTIYHEEKEPRALKAGQPVPEGWTTEPGSLSVIWKNKPDGSWYREVKK